MPNSLLCVPAEGGVGCMIQTRSHVLGFERFMALDQVPYLSHSSFLNQHHPPCFSNILNRFVCSLVLAQLEGGT